MKKMLGIISAVLLSVALLVVLKNQYGSIFAGNTYEQFRNKKSRNQKRFLSQSR